MRIIFAVTLLAVNSGVGSASVTVPFHDRSQKVEDLKDLRPVSGNRGFKAFCLSAIGMEGIYLVTRGKELRRR